MFSRDRGVQTLILFPSPAFLLSSKRKDSEPRAKCLLNNADLAPHHPKDPVEMRRINFQTPGGGSRPQRMGVGRREAISGDPPHHLFAEPHGAGLGERDWNLFPKIYVLLGFGGRGTMFPGCLKAKPQKEALAFHSADPGSVFSTL